MQLCRQPRRARHTTRAKASPAPAPPAAQRGSSSRAARARLGAVERARRVDAGRDDGDVVAHLAQALDQVAEADLHARCARAHAPPSCQAHPRPLRDRRAAEHSARQACQTPARVHNDPATHARARAGTWAIGKTSAHRRGITHSAAHSDLALSVALLSAAPHTAVWAQAVLEP